jgi:hypothetical protein
LPTITEFIEQKVGDELRFISTLRECLYREFKFHKIKKISESVAPEFVDDIERNNCTLAAIYNLSVRNKEEGLRANPRIHGIVNFNLDALVEAYDSARHIIKGVTDEHRCIHTIESPSQDRIVGRINSYHPHGYLRFDHHQGDQGKEAASRVLSEHEFFEFYNRSTEIFTYTMLFMLREYPCLFVGMSLNDDNIRRLLFYSMAERKRSRQREGRSDKRQRHFAIMLRPVETIVSDFLETTLTALGVRLLWVDNYQKIPERLAQLAR